MCLPRLVDAALVSPGKRRWAHVDRDATSQSN